MHHRFFAIVADECFLRAVIANREITLKNIEVEPPVYCLANLDAMLTLRKNL